MTTRVIPEAILWHELGGSTRTSHGRRQFLLASGRVLLIRKYRQLFNLPLVAARELLEATRNIIASLRYANPQGAAGYLAGLIYGLIRRPHGDHL